MGLVTLGMLSGDEPIWVVIFLDSAMISSLLSFRVMLNMVSSRRSIFSCMESMSFLMDSWFASTCLSSSCNSYESRNSVRKSVLLEKRVECV